jgi:ribosomal protein S18 acetylase RimI-like enzyme
MRIVALAPELVPAVLAMQRAAAPERAWSEDSIRAHLFDRAHAGGAHVALAVDPDGAVAGVAGWIAFAVARGDFYGAPLVAPRPQAAGLLSARLVDEANRAGAAWIRIGIHPDQEAERAALLAAGFRRAFDFVTVTRPLGEADRAAVPGPPPAGLRPVFPAGPRQPLSSLSPAQAPPHTIDLAAHVELHNACFAEVPNAPPIDLELAREEWERESLEPTASLALVDQSGRERGFVQALSGGEVEAIGVDPAFRGRAIGRWLLDRALAALARSGAAFASARIASTNSASLALFAAAGFTAAAARLPIFQRDLRTARLNGR